MDLTLLTSTFPASRALPVSIPDDLKALRQDAGGVSLADGIFRWFTAPEVDLWQGLVAEAFPGMADHVHCFAADWLGRQFALDSTRRDAEGREQVLLLDLGAGEALEIPATLQTFHEEELVEFHEECLATSFYGQWRSAAADRRPLGPGECVGYQVPLFLGGRDEVANLARTDVEVYWSLTGQLLRQRG